MSEPRPPEFNLLRAAFLLLAAVFAVELLATLIAVITCAYAIAFAKTLPLGSCAPVRDQLNSMFGEMLASVLALLLAARGGPRD